MFVVVEEAAEKGDDAALGVGVVEPVGARVGGVGGVVCQFGCVELVPAGFFLYMLATCVP